VIVLDEVLADPEALKRLVTIRLQEEPTGVAVDGRLDQHRAVEADGKSAHRGNLAN
jgi:hypothetical protein